MNIKTTLLCAFASILILFSSCVPRKSFTLLYNMKQDSLYTVKYNQLERIKPNDRIGITVIAQNPALAMPFNTKTGNVSVSNSILPISINKSMISNVLGGSTTDNRIEISGFLVDDHGDIYYPILGQIHVSGNTLREVSKKIETLISQGGYIQKPVVEVKFINFHVYIINGNYSGYGGSYGGGYGIGFQIISKEGKLNLIEAIARGVSLNYQNRIDHVAVFRTTDKGERQVYYCNPLNTDVFNSPAFNLQNGDIIYVAPKAQSAQSINLDNLFKYSSYIFTTLFTVTSLVNIFNR